MRFHLIAFASFGLTLLGPSLASAQIITTVYNRDTHEAFRLKRMDVSNTIIGPIVRTSTLLTFDNPFKNPTEAALNFNLLDASALGGFAYFYGAEYVPGRLMDKSKAWQIYTAITSRGRDPGIMEQMSPSAYHCQIFPIRVGQDLRVRLWTVSTLRSKDGKWTLPKPTLLGSPTDPVKSWKVRDVDAGPAQHEALGYEIRSTGTSGAVSQRFKDGRTYVAGILRVPGRPAPKIEILHAYYEPQHAGSNGSEVTAKVAQLVGAGLYNVRADNSEFGDPFPGIFKQLRVIYRIDGREAMATVPEHDVVQFLQEGVTPPKFAGIQQPKTVFLDPKTIAFFGWSKGNPTLRAAIDKTVITFHPRKMAPGTDAPRLWAQQVMRAKEITDPKQLLAFSLKYGVPSSGAALLAVPKEEMRQYLRREAERRQKELQAARGKRTWGGQGQNWNSSSGGDPEIRVSFPGAKSVYAILPDFRIVTLRPMGDMWGGNFEIPALAPEGKYTVRAIAEMLDGTNQEKSWTYDVDRTAPVGAASLDRADGHVRLQVTSEPGLAEVAAYAVDGSKWSLSEDKPGQYSVDIDTITRGPMTVILKDRASNKGVVKIR